MIPRATSNRAVWLTATAVMAAAAVPAAGEVYLNEAQALAVIFGDKAVVRREQRFLDDATRAKLERASNLRFPETSYTFFIAAQGGQPEKYAVQISEIGKTEPITFMVGMSAAGKVTDVAIMVFRENRGWEVKEKRFLNQFRGKSLKNAVRVDEDIINYTGATLSSKAVARGVKRALFLLETFYPGEARGRIAPAAGFAQPSPLSPVLTASDAHGRLSLYHQSRYAMGSVCEIRVWCRSGSEAHQAFAAGFAEIARNEQIFSAYRDDSELALVNREAAHAAVRVSDEFFRLTRDAMAAWRKSGGAVDATVGPLMKAWGFWQGEPRVPSEAELFAARELVGGEKLVLDPRASTVKFSRAGMKLDFGGLAKGHAAKRAARILEKQGAVAALVNLGRSSLCASKITQAGPGGQVCRETGIAFGEWPIAVMHPGDAAQFPLYFLLTPGQALSTSGTYERQFDLGGKKLSHILDPRSGLPVEGLRSATAIARSGVRSEVLSKQLLIARAAQVSDPPPRMKKSEWAHLETSPSGSLVMRLNFPRTPLLSPAGNNG